MKTTLTTFMACLALSIGFGQNSNDPCSGVTADFTTQNVAPAGGIQFTDASNANGNTYNCAWTFGNNKTSQDPNPFAVYDIEGTYHVTLTITDVNGCQVSVEKDVVFSYSNY